MPAPARQRYLANQVLTSSPERLVTLLYDALVASLARAGAGITAGDHYDSHQALIKAQNIVLELQSSLRPELWDGAQGLLAIYHYVYRRLVHANLTKDGQAVAECLDLVEPLQRAWHRAAERLVTERSAAAV